MIPALPIVPPRYPGEALGCWLDRVGGIYDRTAGQLLDEWLHAYERDAPSGRRGLEARIDLATAPLVAQRLRIPASDANALISAPTGWVVEDPKDVAVCPACLHGDDLLGRPRYRRAAWTHCWRVTCPAHRRPLFRMPDWRRADVARLVGAQGHRRTVLGRRILSHANPSSRSGDPIGPAIVAVRELENVIEAALLGRRPARARWGSIEAADFAAVAMDVSSFLLTNFSDRAMRPICVQDLKRFVDSAHVGFFSRRSQPHQTWSEMTGPLTLANAGDVGLRRCALFWTRELMHARSARPWIDAGLRDNRPRRQAAVLNRQCSTGLAWLAERMTRWPTGYRENWWTGTRLLGLPSAVVIAGEPGHL